MQAVFSRGISAHEKKFRDKYHLAGYTDKTAPLIMFSVFKKEDYHIYLGHEGKLIVVWCGSDSLKINNKRAKLLKSREAKHIATHDFGSRDLKKYSIQHEIIPITPLSPETNIVPNGDSLYFYTNIKRDGFYGDGFITGIKRKTGLSINITDKSMYNRNQLKKIYSKCFLGLRLTRHDGVPTTVLELGMMGRKSLFNGSVPHNIHWRGIDDICESIMKEYDRRKEDNSQIAIDIKKFLDIGDDWMAAQGLS